MSSVKKKTYIHINRHTVLKNRKLDEIEPPIAIRKGRSGKPKYVSEVYVDGPSVIIYDLEHPLPCGATCWIETQADVHEVSLNANGRNA